MNNFLVYIIECADGTYYTGITTNIQKRISQHNNGTGSKYAKARRPVRLVIATDSNMSRSDASKLEVLIKSLPKTEKVNYLSNYKRSM
jgi:putative endonuclease